MEIPKTDTEQLSEENKILLDYVKKALEMIDEAGTLDHRRFVQELLTKYSYVRKSKGGNNTQVWEAYNQAQQQEKILLMYLLDELLNYIEFPKTKNVGRNPIPMRDKIFYIIMQSYNEKSGRRCVSDLEIARKYNFVQKAPHFNTVLKCVRDQSVTQYLKHLINVSGIPLQQVETDFSVDSSGFSTSEFGRWLDVRTGSNSKKRKFIKAHITCGTRTNVISAVNITSGTYGDSPQLPDLIRRTKRVFDLREVSADKAYSSKKNLQLISDLGAIPFVPFKSNVTGRSRGVSIWGKMYKFFMNYPDEFAHHYHKRSNVETCFHMLKKKFGSYLRSKTYEGQVNEILAKCLCHNLCVLIQEAFELGINIDFKKCAEYPIAHK